MGYHWITMSTTKIVYWDGYEDIREKVVRAATKVKTAGTSTKKNDNASFFSNIASGLTGEPCHSDFNDIVTAFQELNELKRRLVREESFSLELIRHVSEPILGNGHPDEIRSLELALESARREAKREAQRKSRNC